MAIHVSSHERGFSLLEVMITAVILSLGLLGLVALQTHSKFASYEARQRTIASWLANDMVERVRINRDSWTASGAVTVNLAANLPRPTCAAAWRARTCADPTASSRPSPSSCRRSKAAAPEGGRKQSRQGGSWGR